jgi:hypothetical protein
MISANKTTIRSTSIASIFTGILFLAVAGGVRGLAATKVLTVNNASYAVGESTVYVIKGASPNSLIVWSSWKDGVSTGEVDSNYGQWTDAFGNWSASAGPWTESLIGAWVKQAKIGGQVYTVAFQVQPRTLPDFAGKVGQYFWTPPQSSPLRPVTMANAADRISELGGRAMHAAFFTSCNQQQTLLQRAQVEDAVRAFGNPNIKSYALTTYGAAGCGFAGRTFFDPKLYPDLAGAIEQEFKELTLHLYQTYHGTGKRFVISTWEGDNVLHCGSAYLYANNLRIAPGPDGIARDAYGYPMPKDPNDLAGRSVPFRDYCDAIYPRMGIANVNEAHEGYRLWLEARQRGVRQGRDEAIAQGLAGVEVYHAPEINVVNMLERPLAADGQPLVENGEPVRLKSILRDVLPALQNGFDFISYSAYETTNLKSSDESMESLRGRVRGDLETIRQIAGTRNIIIGEFGYARISAANPYGLTDSQIVLRTEGVMEAALDWGVAAIFTWQMFDDHWGTFDSRGNLLPLGDYFRQRYSSR